MVKFLNWFKNLPAHMHAIGASLTILVTLGIVDHIEYDDHYLSIVIGEWNASVVKEIVEEIAETVSGEEDNSSS